MQARSDTSPIAPSAPVAPVAPVGIVQPPLRLSRDFIDYPYYCDLAVAQAAAVLRGEGRAVRLVDAFALPGSDLAPLDDEHLRMGAPVSAVAAAVGDASVVLVLYTPFHRPPSRDPLLAELLDALRRRSPELPIVLADLYQSGQHYVESDPEAVLAAYPEVDLVQKYEAEALLPALCAELIEHGRPPERRVVRGCEDVVLDDLPLPAWDLVDLPARDAFVARVIAKLGRGEWAFPADGRTLPAITSRGCPYRCMHCSSNPGRAAGAPKRQRRFSAEYVTRAVDALVREHGATRIALLDEMVNVRAGHFDALLAALAEHDVAFDFPNGMRADWVEHRHLEAMRGRIATLSVSAESGAQRVVDEVVDKKLDLAALERTVAAAAELGIPTLVHYMIGLPGETRAEINETLEHALGLYEAHGAWPAVQFATPLPGTRLAEANTAGDEAPVDDFGPLFQHTPVTRSEDFSPEELRRFKWTFEQRLAAGEGPQKVILNVTYRCNNHCAFCAVGNRSRIDGDYENQRHILRHYAEKGIRLVDFDGGEPTLYDKLLALIRYARELGYQQINVTTNGRLCSYEAFAARLVRSGLTTLLFSLHGPDAATHEGQTGAEGSFAQTTAGITNCVRHAPAGVELGMNVTVTRSNYERLPELAALCARLGVRWMNLQFLTPFGRATLEMSPDTGEAAKIAMETIDRFGDRIRFQVINLPFCFMPGYESVMAGDLLKLQRNMVFVNNEGVNLYAYLEQHRRHTEVCRSCPHKIFCGGFYDLKGEAQEPWSVTPEEASAPLGTCSKVEPG